MRIHEIPLINMGPTLHARIDDENFMNMPVIPAKAGISWTHEGSITKNAHFWFLIKKGS